MGLVDAYLFVDWSARRRPSPVAPTGDAIWVGELTPPSPGTERYCRTRAAATRLVRERLLAHVAAGRRVLVGFDVPYGYPAGLARALGLGAARPWRATWDLLGDEVEDGDDNVNNRFAVAARLNRRLGGGPGPFWGCAGGEPPPGLTPTMTGLFAFPFPVAGGSPLARLRATERAMGGVQEAWKLAGVGAVGSQALVGIPRIRALRDDSALAPMSAVWPFETGFGPRPTPDARPFVLHAEAWPGIVPAARVAAEVAATGALRDQAQVRLLCRRVAAADATGELGGWLDPAGASPAARAAAVAEEGWILGSGVETAPRP